MRSRVFLLAAALGLLPAFASAQTLHLAGYVTAVEPPNAFDLEGVHVRLAPTTQWHTRTDASTVVICSAPTSFYLGETLDATGKIDTSTHTLSAADIVIVPPSPASVSGTAIIDLVPPASAAQPATDRLVRVFVNLPHTTEKTKLN